MRRQEKKHPSAPPVRAFLLSYQGVLDLCLGSCWYLALPDVLELGFPLVTYYSSLLAFAGSCRDGGSMEQKNRRGG